MQIDMSFHTWQRLTALLRDEHDSYDAVIERLLQGPEECLEPAKVTTPEMASGSGATFKGVFLPHGTKLRATYKGGTYHAEIRGDEWVDVSTGDKRSSPSQAAYSITGGTVNGWLFWLVQRPGEEGWRSLIELRSSQ